MTCINADRVSYLPAVFPQSFIAPRLKIPLPSRYFCIVQPILPDKCFPRNFVACYVACYRWVCWAKRDNKRFAKGKQASNSLFFMLSLEYLQVQSLALSYAEAQDFLENFSKLIEQRKTVKIKIAFKLVRFLLPSTRTACCLDLATVVFQYNYWTMLSTSR